MAVHGQRGPVVVVRGGPAASQFRLPVAHGVLGAGEQPQLAAQRLGLGAAVEAKDGAPLAGRLVAEGLGITDSGQRQAGDEQEDGGQAIESGGQAEQAVGGVEQTLAQQHRQCREDAAASDAVGWLSEHRRGLGQQTGAGKRAALDVARRATHGSVLVAGIAGGAISCGRRFGVCAGEVIGGHLRSVRDCGERRRGGGDDAGASVLVEGGRRDAELPSAGAAAHPGSEQFGRLGGHLGVDDGTSAPSARLEEGVLAVLTVAFDGACEGGTGDVEGSHDVGLADAGNDLELGGAQQHGAAVVGGVAIEGFEVEEVVGNAIAGLHGVAVADGSGIREGERERGPWQCSYYVSLHFA